MERPPFEKTIKETEKLVFSIIYGYVKDPVVTQDLAQDTYLKAFSSLDSLRNRDQIKSWLCTIARNCALKWLRKKKELTGEIKLAGVTSLIMQPADEFDKKEIEGVLNLALEELNTSDREILSMRYVGDMSYKEIAAALEISPSAVGDRLYRLVHKLREKTRDISGEK